MLVADDFSQRFLAGEEILGVDEAERFIDDMDIKSFWIDERQHRHHNNWFYEFIPVVRVCRSLDEPNCKVKFTGLTDKPYDALIYVNERKISIESTCAINHLENMVKKEIQEQFRREIAPEWSNSYEDPVTYGELGGKFNSAAPIEYSGKKSNRQLKKSVDGFYPRSNSELQLLNMITNSMVKKVIKYSWDNCEFKPDWLLIVFDNAYNFERNFLIEILALIESRGPWFEKLYLVSVCDDACIGSHDKEVRELAFKLSGSRRWVPITIKQQ